MPYAARARGGAPKGFVLVPEPPTGPGAAVYWTELARAHVQPALAERRRIMKQNQRAGQRDRERAILKQKLAAAEAEIARLRAESGGRPPAPKRKPQASV